MHATPSYGLNRFFLAIAFLLSIAMAAGHSYATSLAAADNQDAVSATAR